MLDEQLMGIVDLRKVSHLLGAQLRLEALALEVAGYVSRAIPSRQVSMFLWDDQQGMFSSQVSSSRKSVDYRPSCRARIFGRAHSLYVPVFAGGAVYCPIRSQEKFLGLLVLDRPRLPEHRRRDNPAVLSVAKVVNTVLGNAYLLADAEKRNQDMFRFNVLSRALNPTVSEEEIVKILSDGLQWMVRADVSLFLIVGKQGARVYVQSLKPLSSALVGSLKKLAAKGFAHLARTSVDLRRVTPYVHAPAARGGQDVCRTHITVPLVTKDQIIGLLLVANFSKAVFSARDNQNLSALASHGAVAFENARLYDNLRLTYFSIVSALTSAIEAKDPYTRGHSVLVSRFAVAIASAMNLSRSMIESIEIAGLLHDLGKIGVPEDILCKKDKLTSAEYEVVKGHPEIALKILGPVEFPSFLGKEKGQDALPELTLRLFELADLSDDVKLMIFHHHERYGGGGYPRGIKKEEIPLGARILAVADTFEALTADRPYRKAFGPQEALKIVTQVSGEQLDPAIVRVFAKLLKEKGFAYLKDVSGRTF
jgi:HD-GYP domain-containing protein (c-di-GMP phosphodiesterase class II)